MTTRLRTTVPTVTLAFALTAAMLPACDLLEKLKKGGEDAGAAVDAAAVVAPAVTTAAPGDTTTPPPGVAPVVPGAPVPVAPGVRPAAVRLPDAGVVPTTVDAGAVRAADGGAAPVPTPGGGGLKVPPLPFDAGAFKPPPGMTIPTALPTTIPTWPPPAK